MNLISFFPPRASFNCLTCHRPCCREAWGNGFEENEFQKMKKLMPEIEGYRVPGREKCVHIIQPANQGCPFLDPTDSFCSIHKKFGAEQKPPSCQVWPYFFIPFDEEGITLSFQVTCANIDEDSDKLLPPDELNDNYELWNKNGRFFLKAYQDFYNLFKKPGAKEKFLAIKERHLNLGQQFSGDPDAYLSSLCPRSTQKTNNALGKEILNYYFDEDNPAILDIPFSDLRYYYAVIQQTLFNPANPVFLSVYSQDETKGWETLLFYGLILKIVAQRLAFYEKEKRVSKKIIRTARDFLRSLRVFHPLDKQFPLLFRLSKIIANDIPLRVRLAAKIGGYNSTNFSPADYL